MKMEAVPFFDRVEEVAALRAALDGALEGDGRLVLLAGEPGIGKTRLAMVLAGEAGSRGVPVWWGRGWEDGSAPAFWPWHTALRRWMDRVGPAAAAEAAGAWGAELAHVFPALRDHALETPPSEGGEPDRARFRVFDIVSRFLAAVARPSGLVVVLDDLQWADRSSLKLLEFVAANLADTRLLVIATYRDTEVRPDDALAGTLARLVREPSTRRLLLGGLPPAHCAHWIASTGAHGDATALGEALHRETNGNPLFMAELVQLLAVEQDLAAGWDRLRVPHGVHEVIARRLDRLGAECRATLATAALLGDTFDATVLAAVLGDERPDAHLARALHDRILLERDPSRRRYSFAHALIRRALADEFSPSARAEWHARIAAVLERQASASERVTTELVHHLAAAGTADALRAAFAYACRGAAQAARGLGWEEAVRLYEIALDVGERSGQLDARQANALALELARALRGVGDTAAARARCEGVMTACRRTADPETFARAALLFAGPIPEWGKNEPAVRAVLEEACRMGALLPDAPKARLYARLAGDLIAANAVDQGPRIVGLCDEAAAAARRANATDALAVALLGTYTTAVVDLSTAEPGGPLPDSDEALAAAEASGEHEYAAATRYLRTMAHVATGDRDAFWREADALATAAAASRVPEALWFAEVLAALRATLQGRFVEAREGMERALGIGQRAQLANAVGVYGSQRIMWHALQGDLTEIGPELDAFVDAHPLGGGWRPFRALARLARGDVAAARAEFQTLVAAGIAPAERGVMARTYLAGLAALCVALRSREHAPMLYDCIARRADAWSIGGGQTLGPWALALGALARLCDRPGEAIRHFETAIRLGRRMGSPPIVARAQSMLASVRLAARPAEGARERIAAMLAEAAHTAQELGLVDVTARVARLRAAMPQGPAPTAGNVFRQDGEVWTVRFAGHDLRLKDGKGPRYLASLLAAPGREVHVLQFVPGAASAPAFGVPEGLSITTSDGALDDAPDEQARRAYRVRIDDLRAELEEAEQFADSGRSARVRGELEHLLAQLGGARFGARSNRRGPGETARKAVTKVLRTQIGKLLDLHPALGRHLREAVRMGTVCVYAPATPVDWDVAFGPG
jgi:hypothetical protein